MVYETLAQFNIIEYNKYMSLIFDINENLFNEILYAYIKKIDKSNIIMYDPKIIVDSELGRIFINYILFSLLINKYTGFKCDEFVKTENKNNNFNKRTYINEIKELLFIIGYGDIKQFENDQKIFPYKIVLKIFELRENKITKLMKLLWLKKLYPLVVYSMKKSELYKNIDFYLPIYGINQETIDIRYFNYYKIQLDEKEILLYFQILSNFISNELYITKAEKKYFNDLTESSKNKEKYLYRPYLQNYIELQLYMIIMSLSQIKAITEFDESNYLYKKINDILDLYEEKSFYKKYNLLEYDEEENYANYFYLFIITVYVEIQRTKSLGSKALFFEDVRCIPTNFWEKLGSV